MLYLLYEVLVFREPIIFYRAWDLGILIGLAI